MEYKTSITYRNEILGKYNSEKGGEMSNYLLNPTPKQIREACIWLLNRRNEKYDEGILNRFFKFEEGENKLLAIERIEADRFKPIVNFLKGKTKSTNPANLELISWLIDFKPRPLSIYLKSNLPAKQEIQLQKPNEEIYNLINHEKIEIPETEIIHEENKSITIISKINSNLKITTTVIL